MLESDLALRFVAAVRTLSSRVMPAPRPAR
jgi:hypothetical protein